MLLDVIDLLGVVVFAVSGALAAGRKSLDLLGVVVIALVTAIGGGTVRDLLLDRHPVFWVEDSRYLLVIAAAALATVAWTRWRRPPLEALTVADALGLGFFVIAGAQVAEAVGTPPVGVAVMGVITGVVGGMIRDVLTTEVPMILRHGELYATAAIVGVTGYLLLKGAGLPAPWPTLLGMGTVVGLRLAGVFWGLRLPVFSLDPDTGVVADRTDGSSDGSP